MAKTIFRNKGLSVAYEILDKYTAGLVLSGWEVKSLQAGRANLNKAYVQYDEKARVLWLKNSQINSWISGEKQTEQVQWRDRRLLLHRAEIGKLNAKIKQPGYTASIVEVFSDDRGILKLVVAVVKGKKKYERKQEVKDRDVNRDLSRARKGF